MKRFLTLLIASITLCSCTSQETYDDIVTSDIEHFWTAYDKITATSDTAEQMQYLKDHYLEIGTPGLKAIMEARRYQPREYLDAINDYPRYWNSIRENTLSVDTYARQIQRAVDQFKTLYPRHGPAKVYFEIGVFRTPGTALDSLVLIGAEMAMADAAADVSELPERMNYVKNYVKLSPVNDLPFLMVHEYMHTQQNANWAYDLLSQSVFEGSAEFVAELATGQPSIQPAIAYGKQNDGLVKEKFAEEMFSPWFYNWIWNDQDNEFNTRDLGYYVGYAIVEEYYRNAADKQKALAEIIELDYTDPEAVELFVENTGYFSEPIAYYKERFEKERPTVTGVEGIEQNARNVDPDRSTFTVLFSAPMDKRFRSTDFGELGKDHFPNINSIEFSEDGKSATYTIELKPDTEYEMVIESGYRTARAIPLKPYTLRFTTGK